MELTIIDFNLRRSLKVFISLILKFDESENVKSLKRLCKNVNNKFSRLLSSYPKAFLKFLNWQLKKASNSEKFVKFLTLKLIK